MPADASFCRRVYDDLAAAEAALASTAGRVAGADSDAHISRRESLNLSASTAYSDSSAGYPLRVLCCQVSQLYRRRIIVDRDSTIIVEMEEDIFRS